MDLTEPFANLRKKYVKFIWSEKQKKNFWLIKSNYGKGTSSKDF